MTDAVGFAYAVLLLGALVKAADWIAPYENLSAEGCVLDYVYDGDTVALDCVSERQTARLVGFDTAETKEARCPEEAAHGAKATQRLRALATTGLPTFSGQGRDKYGRLLVVMRVDGIDVSKPLIAEGLAVAYRGGSRINWCDALEAG